MKHPHSGRCHGKATYLIKHQQIIFSLKKILYSNQKNLISFENLQVFVYLKSIPFIQKHRQQVYKYIPAYPVYQL